MSLPVRTDCHRKTSKALIFDLRRRLVFEHLEERRLLSVFAASSVNDATTFDATGAKADIFGDQQVISTLAYGAQSVYAADLDGDGDLDVLSASSVDDKIAWYQNRGGGTFGPQQVITKRADYATSAFAADLDGDGDLDVLSASGSLANKIAWYENQGGGSFGPQQVITTQANSAYSVYATDLDGDGDQDVLSASSVDDKIAWYENQGGGSFAAQQVITTLADCARSVYAADLDGDGDQDVLSASRDDDKIAWYQNLGGGSFAVQQVITTVANGARLVYAADLDGDGDLDVLSSSRYDNKIAWYENITDMDATPPMPNPSTWQTEPCYATGDTSISMAATPASDISGVEYYFDEISGNPGGSDSGWQDANTYEDTGLTLLTTYTYQVKTRDKSTIQNEGRPSLLKSATTDMEPPTVDSFDPPDGAAEVTTETDLVIDFSEDVQKGSGNIVITRSSDVTVVETIPVTGVQVAISGKRATIDPSSDLGPKARYYVQVNPGAFRDLSGNDYAGISDAMTWNFSATLDTFGPQQVITAQANYALSVYAADLDGDGDLDVLSASVRDGKIAWYENQGGGAFGPQQVITTQANGAESVYAADLDGDGDLDVLSASRDDSKIAWYENLMGVDATKPEVVAHHIFYNNSAFDENDPAAGAADDEAVATDKDALLPGQTATFANYTSYGRGINGVMVDIAGLPPVAEPLNPDDYFRFKVSNDNDPDGPGWREVAELPTLDVREGRGVGDSDRVTITWDDNAIQNQWLQVTVLTNENTGLGYPDVFYFGNAIGEAGDSDADTKVNALDVLMARNNPRNASDEAPIDFRYDYNRDGRVNATDMLLARENQTHLLDALKLISMAGAFELIENGGFETGDFTGWNVTPTAGPSELTAWTVGPAGGGFFFDSSPLQGAYSAYNGFDGEAGLEYTLSQDVTIPADIYTATLTANYRIEYGEGGLGTEDRIFRIEVRDTIEDVVLASYAEAVFVQGPAVDRGWNTQALDLSAHGGKTVTLRFYELVPQTYTGPAIIELDDISLMVATIRQAKDDVLYYGNAVGEAGNLVAGAKVDAVDVLLARNNPRNVEDEAAIDFRCDFNRDQRVNATDMLLARDNQTHLLNSLKLISASSAKTSGAGQSGIGSGADEMAEEAVWWYDFEQMHIQQRPSPSKKDHPGEAVVDLLL